jgi:hypothetical protein
MSRWVDIYSTRKDALALLLALEARGAVQYALKGMFRSAKTPVYGNAAAIPKLGVASLPHSGGVGGYLILPAGVAVVRRQYRRVGMGVRYLVDPTGNPECVRIVCGGQYRKVGLVRGSIVTKDDNPGAERLFGRLYRLVRKLYTKARSRAATYVGPEAMKLLLSGGRLSGNLNVPANDLVP